MKSYTEFITEAFNIVDGKFVFNVDDGISSSFGKSDKLKPFKKISSDLISYSLYNAKSRSDVTKAIKTATFDEPMNKFITRSSIYAARVLRDLNVDIIVTPKSSSPLANTFAKEVQKRTNYDFFIDSFKKTVDMSKVTIDRNSPKITPEITLSMEKALVRAKKKGFLSVKAFLPQHRKFIQNLFELVDDKLVTKVSGKHVVIIDDVMTSGTTAQNMYDILMTHGAEKVTVLTIFKS